MLRPDPSLNALPAALSAHLRAERPVLLRLAAMERGAWRAAAAGPAVFGVAIVAAFGVMAVAGVNAWAPVLGILAAAFALNTGAHHFARLTTRARKRIDELALTGYNATVEALDTRHVILSPNRHLPRSATL